jgi:Flp pilus assembly pilin Flp
MIKHSGQGVTEYGLIGTLIALVAVGGIALLGPRLSGLFAGMLGKKPAAVAVVHNPLPGPVGPSVPIAPDTSQGNVSLVLSPGQSMSLNMPTNLSKSVQTLGANGTTELLASNMTAMTQQMLTNGQITEAQANAVMQLANQAHHIANIEKQLEDVVAGFGMDSAALQSTPVTIDGKTYANAYEAALSIGVDDSVSSGVQGPELQQFWELYTKATQQTYMWPQAAQDALQYEVSTIHNLSDSLRVTIRDIAQSHVGTPADFNNLVVDTVSHTEAADICEMDGANTDSGVHCNTVN